MNKSYKKTFRLGAFLAVAVTVISMNLGCDSVDSNSGGQLFRFTVSEVNGNNQIMASGGIESNPMVVRVELNDSPINGITVEWKISEGDGSLSSTSSITDEDGYAQTTYISGSSTGETKINAHADPNPSSGGQPSIGREIPPVSFIVTVEAADDFSD